MSIFYRNRKAFFNLLLILQLHDVRAAAGFPLTVGVGIRQRFVCQPRRKTQKTTIASRASASECSF
jgi:hypothetical protein